MTTPTAADYAAALATLSTMCVADGADVLEAALTYVRAKLAADEANERYIELAKRGGYGDNPDAMNRLDAECDRLHDAAVAAYRALVALAAGASEVAP